MSKQTRKSAPVNAERLAALDAFLAAWEAEHGVITEEEIGGAARRARERAIVVRPERVGGGD